MKNRSCAAEVVSRRLFEARFYGRAGGVSLGAFATFNLGYLTEDDPAAVAENRKRILEDMGVPSLYLPAQVHSDRVAVLSDAPPAGLTRGPEADAVISRFPGAAVGVLTADCVPILLGGIDTPVIAAVHAGWRGLANGIIAKTVGLLRNDGLSPSGLEAFIGPAIGPCCYEVGEDLAKIFQTRVLGGPEALSTDYERPRLDLPLAAFLQLREAGLSPDRIKTIRRCTACEEKSFFSHRKSAGTTGRQLPAIFLKSRKNS